MTDPVDFIGQSPIGTVPGWSPAVFQALMNEARALDDPDKFPAFYRRVFAFRHTPHTQVAACVICALAAFSASSRNVSLAVGWQAMAALLLYQAVTKIDGPFQVVSWANALYPDRAAHFDMSVPPDVMDWLKEHAAMGLALGRGQDSPALKRHLAGIAAGFPPFGLVLQQIPGQDDGFTRKQ